MAMGSRAEEPQDVPCCCRVTARREQSWAARLQLSEGAWQQEERFGLQSKLFMKMQEPGGGLHCFAFTALIGF